MFWTKELPSEPGWYWFRNLLDKDSVLMPEIVRVRLYAGELAIENSRLSHWIGHEGYDYEWAGPIPLPEAHRTCMI